MRRPHDANHATLSLRGRGTLSFACALVLTGCALPTPLPLSPAQLIAGEWPRPAPLTAGRAYTIKGDTFTFTDWGVSLTRPSQEDWAFLPGADSVTVRYKGESTEPRPSLSVQLVPLGPEADLEASVRADADALSAQGAKVAVAARPVAGLEAPALEIEQQADGVTVSLSRTYVRHGRVLVVLQASGTKEELARLAKAFEQMLAGLELPKE